jgi:hypothetical protein
LERCFNGAPEKIVLSYGTAFHLGSNRPPLHKPQG